MKFVIFLFCFISVSFASPLQEYLTILEKQARLDDTAFQSFSVKRGEEIFTSKHIGKRGDLIACTTCHTNNLQQKGENVFTGKVIDALSPNINQKRLSSIKNMKKWLRRNFKDVYNKEGTALQKGDVLTYIMNQ